MYNYVIESVKKYPKKLIGYISVMPKSKDLEKEINRCMKKGLCGIGELFPYGQGFDISESNEVKALANSSIERNLPVIIHTNEPVGHYYHGETDTTPVKACEFARNFPELKIIFAHWGRSLLLYELMPEIKKQNKNIYYDTTASPFLYNRTIYKVAKEIGILDKILFGSDYPLIHMKRYIKEIEDSGLKLKEQTKILGKNAQKLLNIK